MEGQVLQPLTKMHAYSQASFRQILLVTIPGEKKADWDYYDTFNGFRRVMAKQNSNLRDMIR